MRARRILRGKSHSLVWKRMRMPPGWSGFQDSFVEKLGQSAATPLIPRTATNLQPSGWGLVVSPWKAGDRAGPMACPSQLLLPRR